MAKRHRAVIVYGALLYINASTVLLSVRQPLNILSLSFTILALHTRAIQERAESVSKKIGEKLTPEIRNSLKNAVSLEEVEEVVGADNTYLGSNIIRVRWDLQNAH